LYIEYYYEACINRVPLVFRTKMFLSSRHINHWLVASLWQTVSHNVVSSTPRHEQGSNSQL
jgi:hypothetical protein